MSDYPRDPWWEVRREREWTQGHFGVMTPAVSRLWDAWRGAVKEHPDLKIMNGRFALDESVPSRASVALLEECLRLHGEDRVLDAISEAFYWSATTAGGFKLPLLPTILRPLVPSDVAEPCGGVADWRLGLRPPDGIIACTGTRHERSVGGDRHTIGHCPEARRLLAEKMRSAPASPETAPASPADQRFATWTGTENADAFRAAQAFAAGEGRTLILWGTVGTGKTHLGRAVLHETKATGGVFAECSGKELSDWLRGEFDWDIGLKGEARGALRAMMHADVVLLDDVGKATDAAALRSWLHDYLDKRKGRTIFTLNGEPTKGLAAVFGEAVASRALQDATVVKTTGKDHRRRP